MKIPEKGPDFNKVLAKMFKEKKTHALLSTKPADERGRYLHWEKVKVKRTME